MIGITKCEKNFVHRLGGGGHGPLWPPGSATDYPSNEISVEWLRKLTQSQHYAGLIQAQFAQMGLNWSYALSHCWTQNLTVQWCWRVNPLQFGILDNIHISDVKSTDLVLKSSFYIHFSEVHDNKLTNQRSRESIVAWSEINSSRLAGI